MLGRAATKGTGRACVADRPLLVDEVERLTFGLASISDVGRVRPRCCHAVGRRRRKCAGIAVTRVAKDSRKIFCRSRFEPEKGQTLAVRSWCDHVAEPARIVRAGGGRGTWSWLPRRLSCGR